MKATALTYRPGCPTPEREELTEIPDLDWLKEKVGGYIEVVPYFNRIELDGRAQSCVAFCNEQGKLNDLPRNAAATRLWTAGAALNDYPLNDYLAGPVLVLVGDAEFMAEL